MYDGTRGTELELEATLHALMDVDQLIRRNNVYALYSGNVHYDKRIGYHQRATTHVRLGHVGLWLENSSQGNVTPLTNWYSLRIGLQRQRRVICCAMHVPQWPVQSPLQRYHDVVDSWQEETKRQTKRDNDKRIFLRSFPVLVLRTHCPTRSDKTVEFRCVGRCELSQQQSETVCKNPEQSERLLTLLIRCCYSY